MISEAFTARVSIMCLRLITMILWGRGLVRYSKGCNRPSGQYPAFSYSAVREEIVWDVCRLGPIALPVLTWVSVPYDHEQGGWLGIAGAIIDPSS